MARGHLVLLALFSVLAHGCVIEEGCGHSLCGCPQEVELTVANRVVDAAGAAIVGAEVRCSDGTAGPVSTDADGAFSLTVTTTRLEFCEYTECDDVTITAPDGTARELQSDQANELESIVLYVADAG